MIKIIIQLKAMDCFNTNLKKTYDKLRKHQIDSNKVSLEKLLKKIKPQYSEDKRPIKSSAPIFLFSTIFGLSIMAIVLVFSNEGFTQILFKKKN